MLESTIELAFREKVKRLGGIALKFIPLAFAGFPDRMAFLPGGRLILCELKRPGEPPRKLQLSRHRLLRSLGFTVIVIDSLEAVENWVP